jgi:hypothetical protein
VRGGIDARGAARNGLFELVRQSAALVVTVRILDEAFGTLSASRVHLSRFADYALMALLKPEREARTRNLNPDVQFWRRLRDYKDLSLEICHKTTPQRFGPLRVSPQCLAWPPSPALTR